MRSFGGCGTGDCARASATSPPSTARSPPSTRPSESTGRRSSAFVRELPQSRATLGRLRTKVNESAPTKRIDRRISVAPMMDWTDRHCRYFLRGFAADTLLYTEMITTGAVLRGDVQRLLAFDAEEHPVALQLGGSEPADLAAAARIGASLGYDEINLNCGCPSDRVHSGAFGACLMREPRRVADCVAAMRAAVDVPVTVKLRIGVVDAGQEIGDSVDEGLSKRESARVAAARFGDAERAALEEFVDG